MGLMMVCIHRWRCERNQRILSRVIETQINSIIYKVLIFPRSEQTIKGMFRSKQVLNVFTWMLCKIWFPRYVPGTNVWLLPVLPFSKWIFGSSENGCSVSKGAVNPSSVSESSIVMESSPPILHSKNDLLVESSLAKSALSQIGYRDYGLRWLSLLAVLMESCRIWF